jgi:GH24 family phage-related lysozyme (muramidase)
MVGFVTITGEEQFTGTAVIPTKNDVPTVGFGSTVYENGVRVKMGDKITPPRAVQLAANHITKEEAIFRASIQDVLLYQIEFDLYMNWVYQYGSGAWLKSSMREDLLLGNYWRACHDLLLYKMSGGFDCSTPGNKVCAGVWTRQLQRYEQCLLAGT